MQDTFPKFQIFRSKIGSSNLCCLVDGLLPPGVHIVPLAAQALAQRVIPLSGIRSNCPALCSMRSSPPTSNLTPPTAKPPASCLTPCALSLPSFRQLTTDNGPRTTDNQLHALCLPAFESFKSFNHHASRDSFDRSAYAELVHDAVVGGPERTFYSQRRRLRSVSLRPLKSFHRPEVQ
jgi:hypothetical protein